MGCPLPRQPLHLGGHPFLDGWPHPPAPAAPSPSQAPCPAYKQRLPMTFLLFVLESKLSRNKSVGSRGHFLG